jgi:hypothetical protein
MSIALNEPLYLGYGGYTHVSFSNYQNGNIAILLNPNEADAYTEDSLIVTVNINKLDDDKITLDSNNLGKDLAPIVKSFTENSIIGKFIGYQQSGYVDDYPVYEFTADLENNRVS